MSPQRRRQETGQRRQDRPIGPVRLRPDDLTLQHRHLMPEHHDLDVLGRLTTAEQHQPAEHPNHDQIQQTNRHNRDLARTTSASQSRRSSTL
jgi:hypothetical protein